MGCYLKVETDLQLILNAAGHGYFKGMRSILGELSCLSLHWLHPTKPVLGGAGPGHFRDLRTPNESQYGIRYSTWLWVRGDCCQLKRELTVLQAFYPEKRGGLQIIES